ncbi:MAG TPA: hypothetical protein VMM58_00435, partial [Bacteroidota bacterium]|nr:hypothetical protein [Bacteroidota bacterium]
MKILINNPILFLPIQKQLNRFNMIKKSHRSQLKKWVQIASLLIAIVMASASLSAKGKSQMIDKRLFGRLEDGHEVYKYTLKNA